MGPVRHQGVSLSGFSLALVIWTVSICVVAGDDSHWHLLRWGVSCRGCATLYLLQQPRHLVLYEATDDADEDCHCSCDATCEP